MCLTRTKHKDKETERPFALACLKSHATKDRHSQEDGWIWCVASVRIFKVFAILEFINKFMAFVLRWWVTLLNDTLIHLQCFLLKLPIKSQVPEFPCCRREYCLTHYVSDSLCYAIYVPDSTDTQSCSIFWWVKQTWAHRKVMSFRDSHNIQLP